jgi:hypothetical protein
MSEKPALSEALQRLRPGDLVHGESEHGGSLICRVTAVEAGVVRARTITHQLNFDFDIHTGEGRDDEYGIKGRIDSVAPLPAEILATLLRYEETNRLGRDPRLSEAERRAFLFVDGFYRQNPV